MRIGRHPSRVPRLDQAFTQFQENCDILERDPKIKNEDRKSPREFIEWAQKKGIDIPWLGWAENNGLVIDTPNESPLAKAENKTIPSKAAEVAELREAAVQIAIRRHVNDGMPKKNITVTKICNWLIESGEFSSGDPFSTRWRKVEGVRSLLKKPNNPLSDKRFLAAKPAIKGMFKD